MSDQTPLMKQYTSIKNQHPDAILLFRLGDFYEMFGEDAETASRILQIALTTRDKKKENPVPMCGIPYFASENYISKLVKAGHKVAVCEQVEDPKDAKGIVKREVVRVITPGTHAPELPKKNNFILSFFPQGEKHGVALADVSTGEFLVFESTRPLGDEISRFEPAEIVCPESLKDDIHYSETLEGYYVTPMRDWSFDYPDAYKTLLNHFRVTTLEGYGCEGMNAVISAAGALMGYLLETQRDRLQFRKISVLNQSSFMFLDATTQRNLELLYNIADRSPEGSLLWALDKTLTPMGGRFLRSAIQSPLIDLTEINNRLDAVKYLTEDYELIEKLRTNLRNIQDIERLAQKIATRSANARDVVAVKNTISVLPSVKSSLVKAMEGYLVSIGEKMSDLKGLRTAIEEAVVDHPPHSLRDGGIIKKGYHEEVDELRGLSVNAKDYIAALEAKEKKHTGISNLKVGYNKIHGYYIEVTKSNLASVPETYIRKQTLVGGERFITPELKEYETKVLGAEERLKSLEQELFLGLLDGIHQHVPLLMETSASLALIDFFVSLAVVAKRFNYVKPKIRDDETISVTNGRHPVIERLPMSERFIPNDTAMDGESRKMLMITGPNMAGKSTYMRQVALIVLMAQIGSFVPADEATIGIVDRIFTRIGASDILTKGQSTFMVEMVETANILNNATKKSLILLDEIGRGTSTFDGISIAWASAEHIANKIGARTLFATHYIELTSLSHRVEGIRNYNVAVKEWGDEIIFLRKIESGPADKSYGIHVARLAGLPETVLDGARDVLSRLEKQQIGEGMSHYQQMDLFAQKQDVLSEELLSINLTELTPEEVVSKLKDLQKRAGS